MLLHLVVEKMNADPRWKDPQAIISDASVPGVSMRLWTSSTDNSHGPNAHRMLRMLIPLCSLSRLTSHIPSTSGRPLCRSIRDETTSSTGEIHLPRVAILRGYLESELNVNNTPSPFELGIAHILCWKRLLAAFAIT
ncbi:hypothetical protein M405DRAFT_605596 [Rhizopogon salebrosus TDB-379]|nr:hypothetical protein M405DRAFT_605596 [Rhizopogon salebrosus TDB-379]